MLESLYADPYLGVFGSVHSVNLSKVKERKQINEILMFSLSKIHTNTQITNTSSSNVFNILTMSSI